MSTQAMFMTSLAVSAISTGVGLIGQQQQAQTQAKTFAENQKATANAAFESQRQQDADLHSRESQLKTSTAINLDNQKKAALRAKSTATATSESAGVSLDSLMADYDRQYLNYADSQMQQLGFDQEQITRTREGIHSQAQSRVNTLQRPNIQGPDWLGAVAGMAGATFNAYDTYSVRDPATGARTLN